MAGAAAAQEPAGEGQAGEIVVTGVREGTLNLKRLQAAVAAFHAGRDTYAPGSTLELRLRVRDAAVEGMRLTLRRGGEALPVPVGADERFTLPPVTGKGWELVHNRGRARVAVWPLVLSPGATQEDRPLGDLRLQCRVAWEAVKEDISFLKRGLFAAVGGCDSRHIHYMFSAPRPIAEARVDAPGAPRALMVAKDARSFAAPLAERDLPDAAHVRLTYRMPAA